MTASMQQNTCQKRTLKLSHDVPLFPTTCNTSFVTFLGLGGSEVVKPKCTPGVCFRDNMCIETEDGVECGPCPDGYTGDGYSCDDVDEVYYTIMRNPWYKKTQIFLSSPNDLRKTERSVQNWRMEQSIWLHGGNKMFRSDTHKYLWVFLSEFTSE